MGWHEPDDSIRLIVAIPPRSYFGGNDWEHALTFVESLKAVFPQIFLFDGDIYLSGSDADLAVHMKAARKFQPNVGLASPNACYGMILDKRDTYSYYTKKKKTLRDFFAFPRRRPTGNIFTEELGVPLIMIWDHLVTQAAQYLVGYDRAPREMSRPGCLDELRGGLERNRFVHYVPDSGHIEVFERLGICKPGFLSRYVVPAHDFFLRVPAELPETLITDRVLFAGNLNSNRIMTAFGADPVVADVTARVTSLKCRKWETPAWHAYEKIASQKAAEGIAELTPDHSFFWSLGRELLTSVVTTAFRTTVFRSIGIPIDFYGGFTDPDFVADLGRSGQFHPMGNVPLERLGEIYARYQFSVDITHTPFINGSNAKVLDCFAAGGFMFIDWKDDLRQELGEIADEFMYRNADELYSKMDRLKANSTRRLEIIQAVLERIARDLNFVALLSRAIHQAKAAHEISVLVARQCKRSA
jgi:hypothetical protein